MCAGSRSGKGRGMVSALSSEDAGGIDSAEPLYQADLTDQGDMC